MRARNVARVLAVLMAVGACGDTEPASPEPPEPPVPMLSGIDILFVINNSADMADEQARLAAAMPAFFDALDASLGGLPSLHVGVVSTDVGAAPYGCTEHGDDGRLRSPQCVSPGNRYADTAPTADPADIAASAACMIPLGEGGCPWEQPFESVRRALDDHLVDNAGFMRDDALLVVLVLTDEDDCSASNHDLFTTDENGDVGRLSSFRCFEFGVTCDEAAGELGPHGNCRATGSDYMIGTDEFAAFLDERKGPGRSFLGGIMPARGPVEVQSERAGRLSLANTCGDVDEQRWPTVRLHELADTLGSADAMHSLCALDYAPAMESVATSIANRYPRSE